MNVFMLIPFALNFFFLILTNIEIDKEKYGLKDDEVINDAI